MRHFFIAVLVIYSLIFCLKMTIFSKTISQKSKKNLLTIQLEKANILEKKILRKKNSRSDPTFKVKILMIILEKNTVTPNRLKNTHISPTQQVSPQIWLNHRSNVKYACPSRRNSRPQRHGSPEELPSNCASPALGKMRFETGGSHCDPVFEPNAVRLVSWIFFFFVLST